MKTRRQFLTQTLKGIACLSSIAFLGMKGWPEIKKSEIQVTPLSEFEYGKPMLQVWVEEMHIEMRKAMVVPQHMLVSREQWEILTDTTRGQG